MTSEDQPRPDANQTGAGLSTNTQQVSEETHSMNHEKPGTHVATAVAEVRAVVLDAFGEDVARRVVWAARINGRRAAGVWSTGERLAVALVLRDGPTLLDLGYAWDEAVERVAGGMWCPPADFDAWLTAVRAAADRELDAQFAAELARDLDGGW